MKILPLFLAFAALMPLSAQTTGSSQVPTGSTTVLHRASTPTNRPRVPSNEVMECTYGVGYLRLQLPAGVYQATLKLSNDAYVWEGLVTADDPMVEIPSLTGEYTLLCQTDDGRLFTGVLEF